MSDQRAVTADAGGEALPFDAVEALALVWHDFAVSDGQYREPSFPDTMTGRQLKALREAGYAIVPAAPDRSPAPEAVEAFPACDVTQYDEPRRALHSAAHFREFDLCYPMRSVMRMEERLEKAGFRLVPRHVPAMLDHEATCTWVASGGERGCNCAAALPAQREPARAADAARHTTPEAEHYVGCTIKTANRADHARCQCPCHANEAEEMAEVNREMEADLWNSDR